MNPLDPSTVIPIRAVPPTRRAPRERLIVGTAEGLISLGVNLAVLLGLVHLAFPPARALPEPTTISVDLVRDVPKPDAPRAAASPPLQPTPSPTAKEQPPAGPAVPAPAASAARPDGTADPKPDDPPKVPAPELPAAPETAASPRAEPSDGPPTIGTGHDPTPRLVEAPREASEAAEQGEKNQAANAETKPAAVEKPTERSPVATPDIVASTNPAAEAAPPAASTSETTQTPSAASPEEQREAENTAKLAAALPYNPSFTPIENRAPVSGKGATQAKEYRGAVYAAFRKADDIVAEARTRNLKGQAVVVFTIDDKGALTNESIALSSGNPEVDRVALEIIRRSAPFPPPPPGGQRTFSPAIGLGLEEP